MATLPHENYQIVLVRKSFVSGKCFGMGSKKIRRLLAGFSPSHYDLSLDVDPVALSFSGQVTVNGRKLGRPGRNLTFHSRDLNITGAEITAKGPKSGRNIKVSSIKLRPDVQEVVLRVEEPLPAGEYLVRLAFEGEITAKMEGMYPCDFKLNGQNKRLIATDLESHFAREIFPCIDEPSAKATFRLTLTTPGTPGEVVLSNTPIASQQKTEDSKLTTIFEATPKMSTYLFAFVFGEMTYQEAKTKRGVTVRAYATPNHAAQLGFAVSFGVQCLEFYEDYFAIDYPLTKCDLVALPEFAHGAMENWGLMTFREEVLLVDPKTTPLARKQLVAVSISHELAHQWFGNLVTMRWWDDLWLNEGFASWVSYLPRDHFFPEWKVWTSFVVEEHEVGLKFDSVANTHPIEVTIQDPTEIRSVFDFISYRKGSSSLRMLEGYLGSEKFRDGIRLYLKAHAYGNATTTDLWRALGKVAHKPVERFMSAWTTLSGHPIVSAKLVDGVAHLSQQQFLSSPAERRRERQNEPVWPIPLLDKTGLPELLHEADARHKPTSSDTPLLLNQGRSGFFRSVYDADHVERLSEQILLGRLAVEDRLGLLSDTFEAAKAGFAETTLALKMLHSYRGETDYAVWNIIATNLSAMDRLMNDEELRAYMKPYVRQFVAPKLKRLGWQKSADETPFSTLLRPIILSLAASADDPEVIDEALKRFSKTRRFSDLQPELRRVIASVAAEHGGQNTFDKLLEMHNASKVSGELVDLTTAVTSFRDPGLIKSALDLIISNHVRHQNIPYWITDSFANRHGRYLAWEWLTRNWDWLTHNIAESTRFLNTPILVARAFSEKEFLDEYTEFFSRAGTPFFERTIRQGAETIDSQIDWRHRDLESIKEYFKEQAAK